MVSFSKSYLATIRYECHCPRDLAFPWQPFFDSHKTKVFMVFLFVLITSEPISDGYLSFWTSPEIQDGGPRCTPFGNYYAIITSYDVIPSSGGSVKGDIFRNTIYLPSLFVIAFIYSDLWSGAESPV